VPALQLGCIALSHHDHPSQLSGWQRKEVEKIFTKSNLMKIFDAAQGQEDIGSDERLN
jgi:hypothetical protein